MHDQALMRDLMSKIQQVATREGATGVRTIHVSLGALSHMTPEHFREHFDEVAPGTLAAEAEIKATLETDTTADDAQGIRLTSLELEYPD
jgi:hydrogenase nickel incorporation protein HypA/HybF